MCVCDCGRRAVRAVRAELLRNDFMTLGRAGGKGARGSAISCRWVLGRTQRVCDCAVTEGGGGRIYLVG